MCGRPICIHRGHHSPSFAPKVHQLLLYLHPNYELIGDWVIDIACYAEAFLPKRLSEHMILTR